MFCLQETGAELRKFLTGKVLFCHSYKKWTLVMLNESNPLLPHSPFYPTLTYDTYSFKILNSFFVDTHKHFNALHNQNDFQHELIKLIHFLHQLIFKDV